VRLISRSVAWWRKTETVLRAPLLPAFGQISDVDFVAVAPGLPLWYLLQLSRTSGRDHRDICAREGLCLQLLA
jgi:hypothetical protein